MPDMIFRGTRFADELFHFIDGGDFEWAQPDWTVSQFTHHWRRENVLPFIGSEVGATIRTRKMDTTGGETWRLLVTRSRYRQLSILLSQVVSLIENPFAQGGEVEETVVVPPKLRRKLATNHPHILRSLDEGGRDRLKQTLVAAKRAYESAHAAYMECGRHLEEVPSEDHTCSLTLGGAFPPERLVYETYRQSPYEMWHPVKGSGHPFYVSVDFAYGGTRFRVSQVDYHSLKPAMNRPFVDSNGWSPARVFRVLGPRMLDWRLMQVIMAVRDIHRGIPWDYSALYVLPAREAFQVGDAMCEMSQRLVPSLLPRNVVPMMNTDRLSRRENPLDARRIRGCWMALADAEKEGMRALRPEAWVHLSFGLREYRLLAALKYLPTCRSLGGYKEAHRNAEIEVGLEEMQRFLTPPAERDDEIPF